jgi:hypothetical protein
MMKPERRGVTTERKERVTAGIIQEQIEALEKLFGELKELTESVRQEDASAALAAYSLGYSTGALWVNAQLVRAAPQLGPRLVEGFALAVLGIESSLRHVPRNPRSRGTELSSAIRKVMVFWESGLQLVSLVLGEKEAVRVDRATRLTEIAQRNWYWLRSLVLQAVPPDSPCRPLIRIGIRVRKEQLREWVCQGGGVAAANYLFDLAEDLLLLPPHLQTDLFPELRPLTDPATGPGLLRMERKRTSLYLEGGMQVVEIGSLPVKIRLPKSAVGAVIQTLTREEFILKEDPQTGNDGPRGEVHPPLPPTFVKHLDLVLHHGKQTASRSKNPNKSVPFAGMDKRWGLLTLLSKGEEGQILDKAVIISALWPVEDRQDKDEDKIDARYHECVSESRKMLRTIGLTIKCPRGGCRLELEKEKNKK